MNILTASGCLIRGVVVAGLLLTETHGLRAQVTFVVPSKQRQLFLDDVGIAEIDNLTRTMHVPGQAKDPKVVACVEDCIKRIVAAGKVAGCIAADAQAARRYTELGVRYLATHAIAHMAKGSRQFIEDVKA
jgi:hypothetical protein